LIGFPALNFHQAEVTAAIVGQTVSLIADDEAVGTDGVLDSGDEIDVWDRRPGLSVPGSRHFNYLVPLDGSGSAMEQ
jgi:hypothetical protein